MCSQYTLKLSRTDVGESSVKILDQLGSFDSTFRPSTTAPVVVLQNDNLKITPMRFSLIPNWSTEPKVKFATHNARIESINEKPTWKLPFISQHCLVPLSSFYESVYEGPLAGHIIKFSGENNQALWAAGLFDCWKETDPEKKLAIPNIFSFSILTWEPSEFIRSNGHDRSPIFIKEELATKWLTNVNRPANEIKAELFQNAYHPDLKVEIERPLKAGWEKRV